MSLKKAALLIVSLAAMLSLVACGDEPTDEPSDGGRNENGTDSGNAQDDLSAIADLNTLVNKSFVVDIDPNYWTQPPGIGAEIGAYVPKFAFQIKTVDTVGLTFTALMGAAINGAQDMCTQTSLLTGTITTNTAGGNSFAFGPVDLPGMVITGPDPEYIKAEAIIRQFHLSGDFVNQGDKFKNSSLGGVMDLREIAKVFTLISDPNDRTPEGICAQGADLGFVCEECAHDTATPKAVSCLTTLSSLFKVNAVELMMTDVTAVGAQCL
jgi:hypothetical protein